MKIRSKTLEELKETLSLLKAIGCKEEIHLIVKGNPRLETLRNKILKKKSGLSFTKFFTSSKTPLEGRIMSFRRIAEEEPILFVVFDLFGFFYYLEEDAFIFENLADSTGISRALEFVKVLEMIEK